MLQLLGGLAANDKADTAVMVQNTVIEIVSGLIRDWRMYWARACMTAWCKSSTMP